LTGRSHSIWKEIPSKRVLRRYGDSFQEQRRLGGKSASVNCPRGSFWNWSDSKYEILFCSKPSLTNIDPVTFDNANLSDVIIGNRYIPNVDSFAYLGSTISRDAQTKQICIDESRRREMRLACFESVYLLQHKLYKVKGYCTIIFSILLYGAECWSLTEKLNFWMICCTRIFLYRWSWLWIVTTHVSIDYEQLIYYRGSWSILSIPTYASERQGSRKAKMKRRQKGDIILNINRFIA